MKELNLIGGMKFISTEKAAEVLSAQIREYEVKYGI